MYNSKQCGLSQFLWPESIVILYLGNIIPSFSCIMPSEPFDPLQVK